MDKVKIRKNVEVQAVEKCPNCGRPAWLYGNEYGNRVYIHRWTWRGGRMIAQEVCHYRGGLFKGHYEYEKLVTR